MFGGRLHVINNIQKLTLIITYGFKDCQNVCDVCTANPGYNRTQL